MKKITEFNKKNINKFMLPAMMVGFFSLGFFFSLTTWDGKIFISLNNSQIRSIANVDSALDVLSFSPRALKSQSQNILFKNTKINHSEDGVQFYLGSFLTPNPKQDGYQFICQSYSFVELSFISSSVSLSGHKGRLVLQAPCYSQEEEFIGPFWIPTKNILENPAESFFADEETQTFIRFYETAIFLMKEWQLVKARFFNSEKEDGLLIRWKFDEEDKSNSFKIDF